jgi:spore coat polysaccharide biosynthesis predicted glycosyltransferase SpsG
MTWDNNIGRVYGYIDMIFEGKRQLKHYYRLHDTKVGVYYGVEFRMLTRPLEDMLVILEND